MGAMDWARWRAEWVTFGDLGA